MMIMRPMMMRPTMWDCSVNIDHSYLILLQGLTNSNMELALGMFYLLKRNTKKQTLTILYSQGDFEKIYNNFYNFVFMFSKNQC